MFESEIILVVLTSALIVYLFATQDNPYVPINERPPIWTTNKNVINYYGWKGPMFIEDFTNFTRDNPFKEVVPVSRKISLYNRPIITRPPDKNKYHKCHIESITKCRTPTLTSEKDWKNEIWNTIYKMTPPNWTRGYPGNYLQATNNNISIPKNLKCVSKSINKDYCKPEDKISPKCYATKMYKCMNKFEKRKV